MGSKFKDEQEVRNLTDAAIRMIPRPTIGAIRRARAEGREIPAQSQLIPLKRPASIESDADRRARETRSLLAKFADREFKYRYPEPEVFRRRLENLARQRSRIENVPRSEIEESMTAYIARRGAIGAAFEALGPDKTISALDRLDSEYDAQFKATNNAQVRSQPIIKQETIF